MAGYSPLKITGMATGLVQEREEFLLPDDAYPILENAYVWRERIKRKQGYSLLGRLRRKLTGLSLGNTVGAQTTYTFTNIFASFIPPVGNVLELNKEIEKGTLVITIGAPDTATFTDNGLGGFIVTGAGVSAGSSINYATGAVTIVLTASIGGGAITANINYFPSLPVMGLRDRELTSINTKQLIAFDQVYAYDFNNGWEEFIPGNIWSGSNSDFFWSTNYWVTPPPANSKLFWVTNNFDPIRYTNGTSWINFSPRISNGDPADLLTNCLLMIPFRGRLVVFNTTETPLGVSTTHTNRIRWAAIGNPISDISALFPIGTVSAQAWYDDIRGKGGFLDIPTSESIVAIGFVRDNLVIYCENSTWQLKYTGRSIAPFQIEKVNSELGSQSTFSAVQFDTTLVGIGDKGVVECDSYKSERIDIKIPDLTFFFDQLNSGSERVHGIRDFQQRLAYWTYVYSPIEQTDDVFPNRRLVYNYENDSWAIFTDSLTTLGTFQSQDSPTWISFAGKVKPAGTWATQNYPWIQRPALFPSIVGGNQQGFVEYLDSEVTNEISLTINDITGFGILPTDNTVRIKSVNHNLESGQIIQISGIPTGKPFATELNNHIYEIFRVDANQFDLSVYDPNTQGFDLPQLAPIGVYIGGGSIAVRDNFRIVSKKFNFIDVGQNVQIGFIDVLFDRTEQGAVSINIYLDYNDSSPINIKPQNIQQATSLPDTFFNSIVPTTTNGGIESNKVWQRIFCPSRGAFLTIEWTLSNGQMVGVEQSSDVQIDAQIIWMRRAGRQLPTGF